MCGSTTVGNMCAMHALMPQDRRRRMRVCVSVWLLAIRPLPYVLVRVGRFKSWWFTLAVRPLPYVLARVGLFKSWWFTLAVRPLPYILV